jgi:3-oxoacyl-[acyl-carrier protein] reductase
MDLGLKGKIALITGGSHGIGLAVACALAAEGCRVAITGRNQDRLSAAATAIGRNGPACLAIVADAADHAATASVVERIAKTCGGVDILINNVGGGGRWGSEIVEETPLETWAEVHEKNAGAAVAYTRLALPHMRRTGWGRVVTIASTYGKEGGGRPWFTMTKSAEIALMKSLAMTPYLARAGITFNTVAPGAIAIPDTGWAETEARDPQGFGAMLEKDYPQARLGTPEEVASAVAYLCSAQASHINGACVVVDGGKSASF